MSHPSRIRVPQVPDVFQIIVKEKGVFSNVTSPSTKVSKSCLSRWRLACLCCLWGRPAAISSSAAPLFLCGVGDRKTVEN